MKKFFSLVAVLVAAMAINAQTAMTCAEAATAALALTEGAIDSTTLVAVTGYVTNTNGSLSAKGGVNQQTFYMDDTKGTAKTFQAYWCNMPSNEEPALNVGDKVTVTGYLMHYVNSAGTTHQAEMKNGAITIVSRATVTIDTIPATVDEAVEEGASLNSGEYTADVFVVTGVVDTVVKTNTTYFQKSFYMQATAGNRAFEAYNCYIPEADMDRVVAGATVSVTGKLTKYNELIEISGGKVVVIADAPATALETVATEKAMKMIENGQIIIIRNGVRYNALGAQL